MRSRLVMANMLAMALSSSSLPLARYDGEAESRLIVTNKCKPRTDSAERMAAAERKRQRKNACRLQLAQNSGGMNPVLGEHCEVSK